MIWFKGKQTLFNVGHYEVSLPQVYEFQFIKRTIKVPTAKVNISLRTNLFQNLVGSLNFI